MNEPNNHLPGDLMALRYLEALNHGDLEAAAELWEEASQDPALEQRLAEVDETLFTEGAAGSRPMRQPLLRRTRRRLIAAAVCAGLAACVLFLVWLKPDSRQPIVKIAPKETPTVARADDAPWRQYRQVLEGGGSARVQLAARRDGTRHGVDADLARLARLNQLPASIKRVPFLLLYVRYRSCYARSFSEPPFSYP